MKSVAVTVLPFFSLKMAAMTSSFMLMIQKTNDLMWNVVVSVCKMFHCICTRLKRFAPVTILNMLILILLMFDRYFNGQF